MDRNAVVVRSRRTLLALGVAFVAGAACAQQAGLHAPSRTVFKCVVGKTTVYSDGPCLGAQRGELQLSRGLDKSSGKELTGSDVQRERSREQVAEALPPLTGKTSRELEAQGKRMNLSADARSECASLDARLTRAESEERAASADEHAIHRQKLSGLRTRYRQLAC